MAKRYWLMKSEPGVYSIDDLKRDRTTYWEGVRNFQARNFLRDEIQAGDEIFFYHSNTETPGIAGIAKITRAGYPDPSQFDKKSRYFAPKSTKENPLWYVVDLTFVKKFSEVLPLEVLKEQKELKDMPVVRRGQRLSVQPVEEKHWKFVLSLRKRTAGAAA